MGRERASSIPRRKFAKKITYNPIDILRLACYDASKVGLPPNERSVEVSAQKSSSPLGELTVDEERILRSVLADIRQVRHGYVQLVIHDGKVVQIDRLQKERL